MLMWATSWRATSLAFIHVFPRPRLTWNFRSRVQTTRQVRLYTHLLAYFLITNGSIKLFLLPSFISLFVTLHFICTWTKRHQVTERHLNFYYVAYYWDNPNKHLKRKCLSNGTWEEHTGHCGCHYDILKWDRVAYYFSGFQKFKVLLGNGVTPVSCSVLSKQKNDFVLQLSSRPRR